MSTARQMDVSPTKPIPVFVVPEVFSSAGQLSLETLERYRGSLQRFRCGHFGQVSRGSNAMIPVSVAVGAAGNEDTIVG